jgi:hypothetical protein
MSLSSRSDVVFFFEALGRLGCLCEGSACFKGDNQATFRTSCTPSSSPLHRTISIWKHVIGRLSYIGRHSPFRRVALQPPRMCGLSASPLVTIVSHNISSMHMMASVRSNLSFIDLTDRYVPVQSSVLRQLEIRDIIALSRTCKRLNHVYDTTMRTQYNINDALEPYFKSPLEFRQIQAKTDAILCDAAALCFFLRKPLAEITGRLVVFARLVSKQKT